MTLPPPPDWRRHALFLDFDGTLVGIRPRPGDVRLPDATRGLLARLGRATGGALAVLSGRALDDLAAHLRGLDLALSGSHGLEMRLPGGAAGPPRGRPGRAPHAALDAAMDHLAPLARRHALLLERKPGAVALHYRDRPDLAGAVQAAVAGAAQDGALRAMHGDMVSEAALAGIDKGGALRRFMAAPPFAGRIPVMLGDDTTDEDGFAAAQAMGGIGIRIGTGPTVARHRVARRRAALDWLASGLPPPPAAAPGA